MWKYKCRQMFLTLLAAFAVGVLLAVISNGNGALVEMLDASMPAEIASVFHNNPYLIYISSGLGVAGIMNVFQLGSLFSSVYGGSSFILLILMIIFPDFVLSLGMLLLPVSLIITLYGWISVTVKERKQLSQAKVSGDAEIIRIYQLHHPLLEEYKPLALEAKKTMNKINLAYVLGVIALLCILFLVNNLFIDLAGFVIVMITFQYLGRMRSGCYASISSLLYEKCDPEACISALIYFSQRGNRVKIANRALFAQSLIYLDDPSLAQDVLIQFKRDSANSVLAYWSLMAYTYYLLKDENGLNRCQEEMSRVRPGFGAMGLMVKSEELSAVVNKIRLMQGDFNTCKKYYLERLKRTNVMLQRADCEYYIALISFVQQDYVLAKMYFEKTIQDGGSLYFVRNARSYLQKIDAGSEDPENGVRLLEQ